MLLIERGGEEETTVVSWPNTGSNIEVAKPQIFNGEAENMLEFLITCRLYIRIRMRDTVVKE